MKKLVDKAKVLGIDTVGILLIIFSVLTGWLPGPGGIPLFLAGLSLLAINHDWAKRWLKSAQKHGLNFVDKIFVDHAVLKAVYDIATVACIVGGIYLINVYTRNLTLTFAIFLLFTGAGLFFGNRNRLRTLTKKFQKR